MRVSFLNLRRQHLEVEAEALAAATRVLAGGIYVLGAEVAAFEEEWAHFCGVRAAATVGNGTDALTLALLASGAVRLGQHDEVITTPLSAGYTALAILNAGGIPVFADIDPHTYTLDPREAERAITPIRAPSCPSTSTGRWPTWTASATWRCAIASTSSKTRRRRTARE